jgi:hypothetical protein
MVEHLPDPTDVTRWTRRQVLGGVAASAAAIAVLAVVATAALGDRDAEHPTRSSPASTPASSGSTASSTGPDPAPDADTVVRTGDLVSYAAAGRRVMTAWRLCTGPDRSSCASAWQLQSPAGTVRGLVSGDGPSVVRAGDSFVVKPWNNRGVVVDGTGRVRPLVPGKAGSVSAPDALAFGRNGLLAIDAGAATSSPLPLADGVDQWIQGVVGDATVWALSLRDGRPTVSWRTTGGGSWQHHVTPVEETHGALPGYLAVSGDHVATVTGYDGATILPVADVAVTADGGRTWPDLHKDDLPFDTVDAMAATTGGTLYVVTAGGRHLFRSTDGSWTRFTEVPNPHRIDALQPAGRRVLGQGGSSTAPELVALDDAGRSTSVPVAR